MDAPIGWPTANTRLVALLGWPAGHSLSPVMHNAACREAGLDAVYLALSVPPDGFIAALETLAAANAIGANVTVPHKRAAYDAAVRRTDEAELVGAVNTLWWEDGQLVGDNTDAEGLRRAWDTETDLAPGDQIVLLGTGGAARAVVVAAARCGAPVTVVGRRPDAAADIAELASRAGGEATAVDLADDISVAKAVHAARVVVNATPLGLDGQRLPEAFMTLRTGQIAYDLVYNPPRTPFLEAAARVGARGHNGLGMLLWQAAAAYERWFGQPAPVEVMRKVLRNRPT